MSKITDVPNTFVDATTLDPRRLNANLNHFAQQIDQVQNKRYCHFSLSFPFFKDASTPYTQADADEVRRYRIQFPHEVIITNAELRYYGSADNDVYIYFQDENDGYLPSSLENFLEVTPGNSDASATATQNSLIRLEANTEYKMTMTANSGQFSSKNSWVNIQFRSDRFNIAGTNLATSYEPDAFSSNDILTASDFNGEINKIDTAIQSITDNTTITRAVLMVVHDLSPVANLFLRRWYLPQVDSDDLTQTISDIWGVGVKESTNTDVSWNLSDDSSTLQHLLSITLDNDYNTQAENVDEEISDASASPSDDTDDWTITASTIGSSVEKSYILLFYS